MQKPLLKLEEIIWEITTQCNNNCSYCGSKDVIGKAKIDDDKIIEIAKAIAGVKGIEVNVSGGDPLLVSQGMHDKIFSIFARAGIKAKIIINPLSLATDTESKLGTLNMYHHIGVSINTIEELNAYKRYLCSLENITIITNLNTRNYHMLDAITKDISIDTLWTIQYTISGDEDLCLYHNDDMRFLVKNKLQELINSGHKIILGDNMNNGGCGAGSRSLGILYDGTVIPCLSMRAWVDPGRIENWMLYANILVAPLKEIYIGCFDEYKYEEFQCCKDICENKCIDLKSKQVAKNLGDYGYFERDPLSKYPPLTAPLVHMYGVRTPSDVMVYGVRDYFTSDSVGGVRLDPKL